MRDEDRQEIWRLARKSPLAALSGGYTNSKPCRTALLDGRVVFIAGIADAGPGQGVPWMLASDLLTKVSRPFLRECREGLAEMSEGYDVIYNVAWSKNETHLRWLRWLGFEFQPAIPMGPDGELFIPFYKYIR